LGGFGERSKARLDRGRCRFKWAEDEYLSGNPAGRLNESLLTEAKGDLSDAVNRAPQSNDALEAHYWLGKIERLHCAPLDPKSPRRAAAHSAAVAEFETALRLARELKDQLWGEPIAQEWATAALEEAARLTDNKAPGAAAAVTAAERAAGELKPFSAPWY